MTTDLNFFATPGSLTHPGAFAGMLDNLPGDIASLVKVVQNSTIHVFWSEHYGRKLTPEEQDEVQLRWLEPRLERMAALDSRPLTEPRPQEKKLVGNCRDFTLMLVSMLRHQGIPARARCGFGAYFMPNHYEDHWVAEYWNAAENRWILVDAQLDELQCKVLGIPFNPLDVPRDQFIVGGLAWQMCRSGQADPEQFGIFDMHGLGFVCGDFIRDVAALNKVELLPWDCWGIIESESLDDADDLAMLDHLAELTYGDVPDFEAVKAIYETDLRVKVPAEIHSYVNGEMVNVRVL